MSTWNAFLIVCIAGGIGGLFNAVTTGNGFVMWKYEQTDTGEVFRPGSLVTILIGAFAAALSWALYGPVAPLPIGGTGSSTIALTWGAAASAAIIGFGGARWLTNEADKRLLHAAATAAASRPGSTTAAQQIAAARPAAALQIARSIPRSS